MLRPELAAEIRAQGAGRRSLRRQHARGGRRRRPRHGDLGALREGARQGQLRAAVHRRRTALQHPAGRHRGAARALPLPLRARREDRLPGDDRARRRLRHAGMRTRATPRRGRVADPRHQALHQPRRRGRLRDPGGGHGRGRRGAPGDVDVPGRPRHPGPDRARRLPQRLAPRLHQLDPRLRRRAGGRRGAARRGGQGLRAGRHLARLDPAPGRRVAASAAPSARSSCRSGTRRPASSSASRSAASRGSASSSPTWRPSCGPPS